MPMATRKVDVAKTVQGGLMRYTMRWAPSSEQYAPHSPSFEGTFSSLGQKRLYPQVPTSASAQTQDVYGSSFNAGNAPSSQLQTSEYQAPERGEYDYLFEGNDPNARDQAGALYPPGGSADYPGGY
ncbi:uncharacterized protein I303_103760 [Kwoniella dejecticola CBS 10117]|uniref:Uncharacterized protein n=1 Tax=Kwoniella dejecticola CBS 10117 TaxID=1296121 RepID=A0A1A6A7M6_9TREE|nr:uncharacterized protein I303_03778 [Kwoniella dejecticola CBS 10117]OBR86060.1 hypothetical protein I303_03778 [Kwoniella dejecticola CBS 10117]